LANSLDFRRAIVLDSGAFIAKALGDIARAKGMAQVARDAGLSRESLYKALSGERITGFDTILKVVEALGLRLHAEAVRG
jgi:probable addiction module antidote protein